MRRVLLVIVLAHLHAATPDGTNNAAPGTSVHASARSGGASRGPSVWGCAPWRPTNESNVLMMITRARSGSSCASCALSDRPTARSFATVAHSAGRSSRCDRGRRDRHGDQQQGRDRRLRSPTPAASPAPKPSPAAAPAGVSGDAAADAAATAVQGALVAGANHKVPKTRAAAAKGLAAWLEQEVDLIQKVGVYKK